MVGRTLSPETLVVRNKAIIAAICGIILALITNPIHASLGSPVGDAVLLAFYFAVYVPAARLSNRGIGIPNWLRKGITVFYSVEFIVWVAVYEFLSQA